MSEPRITRVRPADEPRPGNWGGIRSGSFTVFALGRDRTVEIDLNTFSVRMDLGGPQLTDVPDHLVAQTLDFVRAVAPPRESDDDVMDELRAENAEAMARGDYTCAFYSDDDPIAIPDGHDCGGCSCHLSAPCQHCMRHLPDDDSAYIAQMLDLTGRGGA